MPRSLNDGLRNMFDRDLPSELMLNSRPQIGKRVDVIVFHREICLK